MAAHYVSLRATRKQRVTDIFSRSWCTGAEQVPCALERIRNEHGFHRNRYEPHFASHHLAECFTRLEAPCLHGTVWYTGSEGLISGLTLSPLCCVTLSKSFKVLVFSSIKWGSAMNCQHFVSLAGGWHPWRCVSYIQMHESTQQSAEASVHISGNCVACKWVPLLRLCHD